MRESTVRPAVRPIDRLAPRQLEVLRCLATGVGYDVAARRLGISIQTVKNHLWQINAKLGTHSTIGALYVIGWIRMDDDPAAVDRALSEMDALRRELERRIARLERKRAA